MKLSFRIKKENGLVDVNELVASALSLFNFQPNGEYTVRVEKYIPKRSLDQNSLMWMWFACIADSFNEQAPDHTYQSTDIYDYFTFKFLSHKVEINGEMIPVISKTSKLKKDEFALFLNQIQSHCAAEFGIVLPNPEDRHFEEFAQQYQNSIK